jgi:hypothetical protein
MIMAWYVEILLKYKVKNKSLIIIFKKIKVQGGFSKNKNIEGEKQTTIFRDKLLSTCVFSGDQKVGGESYHLLVSTIIFFHHVLRRTIESSFTTQKCISIYSFLAYCNSKLSIVNSIPRLDCFMKINF